jgi:hypothetical protein
MEPTGESPQIPEFSAADWQACSEMLWDQAYQTAEENESLKAQSEKAFGEVSILRESRNLFDQEKASNKESTYWELVGRLNNSKEHETKLLETLERIEEGTATEEEVLPLLPAEEDQPEEKLSKRKQAILREQDRLQRLGVLPRIEYLGVFDSEIGQDKNVLAPTDVRRVASGHNRKRLAPSDRVYASDAEGRFIEATQDTHGGKARRPGKNPRYFVKSDGRKIRKR